MRFMVMHKTNAHWELGAPPGRELIDRVGKMIGAFSRAGILLAAEGLRASSQGVRLTFSAGVRTVTNGPFDGGTELPAGFTIIRASCMDEAIEWASRQAEVLGDVAIDIRPVTEPWDIGFGPPPADTMTRRYMVMRKGTHATETGSAPSAAQRARLSHLVEETIRTGRHLVTETVRPSSRGRRYRNSRHGVTVYDGPFLESKELIGGYVVLAAESLDAIDGYARSYLAAVGAEEVDVLELE